MTLRVTLEIVPHGDESQKYLLSCLNISNMGRSDGQQYAHHESFCKYKVKQYDFQDNNIIVREHNRLINHNRQNGAWMLVSRVIDQLGVKGP